MYKIGKCAALRDLPVLTFTLHKCTKLLSPIWVVFFFSEKKYKICTLNCIKYPYIRERFPKELQ